MIELAIDALQVYNVGWTINTFFRKMSYFIKLLNKDVDAGTDTDANVSDRNSST